MRAKEPNFYNQFAGQQAEKFYVSKDGGDGQPIDALSGATITSVQSQELSTQHLDITRQR